jgi:hypothetical protein
MAVGRGLTVLQLDRMRLHNGGASFFSPTLDVEGEIGLVHVVGQKHATSRTDPAFALLIQHEMKVAASNPQGVQLANSTAAQYLRNAPCPP